MTPLSIERVRETLPVVGEHLEKKLFGDKKEECTVTYVNLKNLWYQVTFKNGVRQCYKLPTSQPFRYTYLMEDSGYQKKQGKHREVRVLETGGIFPTVKECAAALNLSETSLRRHIMKHQPYLGYTVVYID